MPTVLHQELQWLLSTELLELPYVQEGRVSHRDALMESILAEPGIAALCDEYLTHLHSMADRPAFRAALERHLAEYGKTRDASSRWPGLLAGGRVRRAEQGHPRRPLCRHSRRHGHRPASRHHPFLVGGDRRSLVLRGLSRRGLGGAGGGHHRRHARRRRRSDRAGLDRPRSPARDHRHTPATARPLRHALGENVEAGAAYRVRDHYIARVFDVLEMLRAATKAFN